MDSADLAAALASRICHDLVSPVGAVVNGVDLMREIGATDLEETVAMVAQSAGRASALLQFYRIAFGAATEDAQPVGLPALRELASVLAQPPRILLEWQGDGPPMQRAEARLLALLVLCARSVTGMRGVISVMPGRAGTFPLVISVEAESFGATRSMLDLLASESARIAPSARSIEFLLARNAAAASNMSLRVDDAPGRVTIEACPAAAEWPASASIAEIV